MINETEAVKENARTVDSMGVPQLPMLLFLSNGSGGTGFDTEARREIPISYISQVNDGIYVEQYRPNYVQNYEYEAIYETMREILSNQ